MTYKELNIGDKIRILKEPPQWSSTFIDECPITKSNSFGRKVVFPFEGTIEKLEKHSWWPALIGGYGWSLDCIDFELISSEPNYNIF